MSSGLDKCRTMTSKMDLQNAKIRTQLCTPSKQVEPPSSPHRLSHSSTLSHSFLPHLLASLYLSLEPALVHSFTSSIPAIAAMSSIPTPSSSTPTAQSASGNGNKPSLRDLIRRYLFCDHDDAAGRGGGNEVDDNGNELSETPGSRLEWTLDNKDRFWRKERDLGLSLEDANGLKTLDHSTCLFTLLPEVVTRRGKK